MLHAKRALRGRGHSLDGCGRAQRLHARLSVSAVQGLERPAKRSRVARHRLGVDGLEILACFGQLERDIDAGLMLDADLVNQRCVIVAPGFDRVEMPADALRREGRLPAVIAERDERHARPVFFVGCLPQQLARQDVVTIGHDVGFDCDGPADDALDGKRAVVDGRRDALDGDAWRLQRLGERATVAPRAIRNRRRAGDNENFDLARTEQRIAFAVLDRLAHR